MAVNKVDFGGETLIDLTNDTVTPETLAEGYTAHAANGEEIVGTFAATAGKNGRSIHYINDDRLEVEADGVMFDISLFYTQTTVEEIQINDYAINKVGFMYKIIDIVQWGSAYYTHCIGVGRVMPEAPSVDDVVAAVLVALPVGEGGRY